MSGPLPGEEVQGAGGVDEQRLVEALKAYDDAAIRLVYRMHADGIYRYALYQLGDRAAAEDPSRTATMKKWIRRMQRLDHTR